MKAERIPFVIAIYIVMVSPLSSEASDWVWITSSEAASWYLDDGTDKLSAYGR